MNQYKYIDSGIEWFGVVPSSWMKKPLFTLVRENKQKNSDNAFTNILSLSYGKIIRKNIKSNFGLLPKEYSGYQIIDEGFIVLRLTDLQNDKRSLRTGVATEQGIITSAYTVLIPNCEVDATYLTFVLHAYDVMKVFYALGSGVRQSMNFKDLKWLPVFLPDKPTQNVIIEYLNNRTAQIDCLITDKEKIIELLKEERQSIISETVTKGIDRSVPMKDSDIEWLGEIPAHWGTSKSRWLFDLRKDKALPGDEQLTASQQLGIVYQKDYMEQGSRVVQVITGADILKHVEPNDFVISMRSFQGGIEWSNLRGKISSAYVMLIPNEDLVFPPFFKWLLKSDNYIRALQSTSNLVRDGQALRYDNFKQVDLPLIPLTEQKIIADYLLKKTTSIDTLIQDIQTQIALLKEYRQSVISEAVTGKYIVPTADLSAEVKPSKSANLHFKRRVLAAKILDELCEEPTLGHVKLEKMLFLSEYCGQLDLHTQFGRHAAGPYNPKVLRSIDSQLKKSKWFDYNPAADTSNKYTRMSDYKNYINYYENYFDEVQRSTIDKLLHLFKTAKTIQCEIVATLYGAWNDFLMEGVTPSDNQIIDEVLSNWHEKKERISRERWQGALSWMRENAIIPMGYGESTKGGAS